LSSDEVIEALKQLVEPIAKMFGPACEVVLHDLRKPDRSIVAIANGHLTGRKVGDTMTDTDLYKVSKDIYPSNSLTGYRATTKDGKKLRCTTIFIRNARGKAYAAFGINFDLSLFEELDRYAQYMLQDVGYQKKAPIQPRHVKSLVETIISETIQFHANHPYRLGAEERKRIIQELDSKGIFSIRGSVPALAKALGVSRATIYKHLNEIGNGKEVRQLADIYTLKHKVS